MPPEPAPIIYDSGESGVSRGPTSRETMTLALQQRRPIEVARDADYINLYHVFCRLQKSDEALRKLVLVRKKIGDAKWLVFPIERH